MISPFDNPNLLATTLQTPNYRPYFLLRYNPKIVNQTLLKKAISISISIIKSLTNQLSLFC